MAAPAVVGISQGFALLALSVLVVVDAGAPTWPAGPSGHCWQGSPGSTGLACFYTALATGTMGVVSPIAALGALVPVLLGTLSGDRPTVLGWVGMAVAIVGAVLASGPELSGAVSTAAGRPRVPGRARASGARSTASTAAPGPPCCTPSGGCGWSASRSSSWPALAMRSRGGVSRRDLPALAVVGLGDVGANAMFAFASSRGLVSVASVLGSLYPVVTILLARVLLGERLRRIQQVGVSLALAVSS